MPSNNADTAGAAERRQQAFELRKSGQSYRAIGESLGVTHTTARRYVDRILDDLHAQTIASAERYRALQLERLNDMMLALWPAVKRGDTAAIREARGLMEREAKLLGIDSPTRIDLAVLMRKLADEEGMDPEDAVAEAERIAGRFLDAAN